MTPKRLRPRPSQPLCPVTATAQRRTLLENAEAFKIYIAERHLVPAPQNDTMKRGEERYLELI